MFKSLPKYPIGIQDFATIRENGYIYVDKTKIIYELINTASYVFLSRPRRFGKSLLLSTIAYYFEGRKDLFEGLDLAELESNWVKHPVFLLSFARYERENVNSLEFILEQQLSSWEKIYNIGRCDLDFSNRFVNIIQKSVESTGQKAVILIDEYDNPLITTRNNPELHSKNKAVLKSIFTILKDLGAYLSFGMLTGITRFGKMSVFSSINNLYDITLDKQFSSICGITQDELLQNFKIGISELAEENEKTIEEINSELKKYYDGYHFSIKSPDIYNPYSLLNAFSKKNIEDYWFSTGTPNFLVDQLKETDTNLKDFLNQKVVSTTISASDSAYNSLVALLFQSGYLTIKDYESKRKLLQLGIPNEEVKEGLNRLFLKDFLYPDKELGNSRINKILDSIEKGNPELFMENLQAFFAGVPFDLSKGNKEVFFHNSFYILCNLIGLFVKAEYHTSAGSIDILIETNQYVYVIELKLDKSAEEAINQINSKDYDLQWRKDERKTFKIGISFSSITRNISEWIIQ